MVMVVMLVLVEIEKRKHKRCKKEVCARIASPFSLVCKHKSHEYTFTIIRLPSDHYEMRGDRGGLIMLFNHILIFTPCI